MMKGNHPRGKIVHLIEKVCSCVHGEEGVVIRVWFIHCEESAPCLWIWVAS
uniref:Uncharacterized protein n=1 Tax=Arundo donax TaxID=35708 RepID=A0A0A8ZL34_ARUDO